MIAYPKIPLSWEIFQEAISAAVGYPVILAGGCLRDLYSGRKEQVKDLDFCLSTGHSPPQRGPLETPKAPLHWPHRMHAGLHRGEPQGPWDHGH